MSVDRPSPSTDDNIKNSKSVREQSFAPDQRSIDQQLQHLKDEVLPFYPLLLTVPSDAPFRLGGHCVNNWAVGNDGPFTLEEHQLQYMTFLTHHEGDSLLVAVGDWSDGTGSIMTDQRAGLQSATSAPSGGSTKKKISLNDYKNKWKGGASASPVNQEATTHGALAPQVPDDKQHASKASPPQKSTTRPANSTAALSKPSPRPASETAGRKRLPDLEQSHSKTNDGKRSPKRPRVSPDRTGNKRSGRSSTNGLPALLSPTLPPTSDSPSLPQLLSPTLPPNIERELANIHDDTLAQDSLRKGAITTSDGLTESARRLPPSNLDAPHLDSTQSPSLQALQSSSPDTAMDRHSSAARVLPGPDPYKTNVPSQVIDKSDVKSRAHFASSTRRQLVIKLRYGRSNKKRVEALLKFSEKRKAGAPCSPNKKENNGNSRTLMPHNPTTVSYRAEKGTRHVSSGEPNVLPRERSGEPKNLVSDKPQTPMPMTTQQGKSKQITPAKDLQANFSRQVELIDGEGKTPPIQGTKYPADDSGANFKLSPSQLNGQTEHARNGERRAWKDEYLKYSNLGRELKHAADRHIAKDVVTASDEKVSAATALEAILCFILAFVTDDQSKSSARVFSDSSSSWRSILAYWRAVKTKSAPFAQLHSLCLILGAVSYDAIHALDLDRLAVIPLPGEHTPVPTRTSDGNVTTEESRKHRKELFELRIRLPECYRESQRLWAEGTKGLSEDVLDQEFPMTWQNRSRRYSERGKQVLKAGDYSGEYFLPLGRTDTPVEIVRFGWSILSEWCRKEGLHWHGRLDL